MLLLLQTQAAYSLTGFKVFIITKTYIVIFWVTLLYSLTVNTSVSEKHTSLETGMLCSTKTPQQVLPM